MSRVNGFMKAVGYRQHALPITDPLALEDLMLPDSGPPEGRDLLVRVHAVSVNPRDVKSRMSVRAPPGKPVVLGYDAAGVVEAAGSEAQLFRPGEEGARRGFACGLVAGARPSCRPPGRRYPHWRQHRPFPVSAMAARLGAIARDGR
jgi:NADPH:quinone reductase-like Zn-dependent oxidoreductase